MVQRADPAHPGIVVDAAEIDQEQQRCPILADDVAGCRPRMAVRSHFGKLSATSFWKKKSASMPLG